MSFRPVETEPRPTEQQSELRLSAPTCQHEYYERYIEDRRFARARCLRCPHSWVEVDISVDRGISGTHDPVRPYPKLIPRLSEEDLGSYDDDGLEPVAVYAERP